jgi:2-(1,2-epoxy-1,2-dihydrophenyl)acetyl-CoA isomerase
MIDAKEALRIGLVSEVVPHEQLMPKTQELAARIAALPTIQLGLARRQIYKGMEINNFDISMIMESHGLLTSQRTEDYQEGHKSFIEKRPPKFTGF